MEASGRRWVSRLTAEAIHFGLVRDFGGMRGIRDAEALESALARPQHRASYDADADLASLAASYCFGIVRGHPFNDGNKRTGFVVMAVFLRRNGLSLDAPEPEVVTHMLDLAAGTLTEDELAAWVRSRSRPVAST